MNAWIPVILNAGVAALGALQGVDWIHLIGSSQAGWIVSLISALNALAHAWASQTPTADKTAQGGAP